VVYTGGEAARTGQSVRAVRFGKVNGMEWDHTYAIGSYCPGEGWFFSDPCIDTEDGMDMLTVHAWCDLEPYKGGEQ